jgi:hypothetical protein
MLSPWHRLVAARQLTQPPSTIQACVRAGEATPRSQGSGWGRIHGERLPAGRATSGPHR